jgi:hypothetical protein
MAASYFRRIAMNLFLMVSAFADTVKEKIATTVVERV